MPQSKLLTETEQSFESGRVGRSTNNWNVARWISNHAIVLVGLTTLLGLGLRLWPLFSSSAGDEISTYYIIHGHSLSRVMQLVHSNQETSPPGYFIVAWMVNQLVGDSALAARLVSFAAGIAAIPLTFVLGVLSFRNRLTALLGALLVALAPFTIFLSTDGRPFMLEMVLCLISTISILKALRTNAIAWWILYGGSTTAAIYTHYTAVFILALQFAWAAVFHRRAWKALLIANAAAVLAYLPWLSGLREDLKAPNILATLVPFSLSNMGSVTEDWWIGHPVISLPQVPGHLAVGLAVAGLVFGGLAFFLGGPRIARLQAVTPERLLIPLLAVGPPLLMAVYSDFRTSILEGRNFMASWPALALTMGAIVLLPTISWARALAVGLLLTAYSIAAVTSVLPVNQRPNMDGAVAYINAHAGRNDPVVNAPLFHNPLSELDVALSRQGESTYTPGQEEDRDPLVASPGHHHVFRFVPPLLSPQLRALAGSNGQPASSRVGEDPLQLAHQTLRLASEVSAGQFVFVGLPLKDFEYFPNSPVEEFLRALPPDYHIVKSAEIQSFGGLNSLNVYIFQPKTHVNTR
jgi:hypothetical protein